MKQLKYLLLIVIGFYMGRSYVYYENKYTLQQDNSIKFEWEGLERDIPKDGNRLINLSTENNTVYLNPVDE